MNHNRDNRQWALLLLAALALPGGHVTAQLTPGVGWEATLSNDAHGVSGRVSIVDTNTLLVDSFTFDGGGLSVYFYLGESDTNADFARGLLVGDQLVGTVFDGTQPAFTMDLPGTTTVDGYHAVSVWCVAAGVSFGSGTFQPVPEPATTSLLLTVALIVAVTCRSILQRRPAHR